MEKPRLREESTSPKPGAQPHHSPEFCPGERLLPAPALPSLGGRGRRQDQGHRPKPGDPRAFTRASGASGPATSCCDYFAVSGAAGLCEAPHCTQLVGRGGGDGMCSNEGGCPAQGGAEGRGEAFSSPA